MAKFVLPEVNAVLPDKIQKSDIVFDDEKLVILEIGEPGKTVSGKILSEFKGQMVFPGFIDPHVHFRTPGKTDAEDWESGSRAALFAGVTTVFDMPNNNPPVINAESYHEKLILVKSQSRINFALFGGMTDNNLPELLSMENLKLIKVYLASTTGSLLVKNLSALKQTADKIFCFHAEHEKKIRENEKNLGAVTNPLDHSKIRNAETAIHSTNEIIRLQKKIGGNFHISHVSTPHEIELLSKSDLSFEVCPHHLFFSTDDYQELGFFLKCNPPVREPELARQMRKQLYEKKIQMIATDHAPHLKSEKERTDQIPPSGVASLEGGTHLILQEAVLKNIDFIYASEILSSNAAKRFSVAKRGKILPGNYADLTIFNPRENWEFTEKHIHSKCGHSPFTGRHFKGKITASIVNGHLYETQKLREQCKQNDIKNIHTFIV